MRKTTTIRAATQTPIINGELLIWVVLAGDVGVVATGAAGLCDTAGDGVTA
jgi:hypothetical protein